jgi:hypothetical protein
MITCSVMAHYLSQKCKTWHKVSQITSTECPIEVYTIHFASLALSSVKFEGMWLKHMQCDVILQ